MKDLERGFIDKNKILEYVSEKQIFKLVFGYEPIVYQYVTSPFRIDNTPGCWFEYSPKGELKFVDFANADVINGIKMLNIDCFDAVQVYYKLGNFYKTLEFIKEKLIDGKNIKHNIRVIKPKVKEDVEIYVEARNFDSRDKRFWSRYGISKQNLVDDGVFAVKRFNLLNTRKGDILKRVHDPCYSFSNFDDGRKKLYRPFKKGSGRFITNCKADDVGEIDSLVEYGKQLVISKSYKDCRVLRNEELNSVWFQNEGMIPSDEILIPLCKRFTDIVVFFDNDNAGITASKKVSDYINKSFPGKARNLYLPEHLNLERNISDPADMYYKMGSKHLQQFLKEKL
jgi:hypothetical protein